MKERDLISTDSITFLVNNNYGLIDLEHEVAMKITRVYAAGERFFRASAERKNGSRLDNDFGYRPIGVEYSNSPDHPDLAESFSVSSRMAPHCFACSRAQELSRTMLDAFDAIERIVESVAEQLARRVKLRTDELTLRGGFHRWSRLQLNYSRPAELEAPYINQPHEDGDFLTLACATAPGLELLSGGESIPVETSPGEALLILGEIAWLLSGGLMKPCWHYVRTTANAKERMALLFFADLDPRLCQPWVRNQINAHVDVSERVVNSVKRFGLKTFVN